MKHIVVIFTAAITLLLTGCAIVTPSVILAPIDQDVKAKEFAPAPNKASLYIYRNEYYGAAMPMMVSVNGKAVGHTAARSYFRLNVMPGKYNVGSHTEKVSSLSLSVEEGKNYFVWQEVTTGFMYARGLLHQVNESIGRAGVTESNLIASSVSDNDFAPLDTSIATPSASQAASTK